MLTGISGVSFAEAWSSREPGDIARTTVDFLSRELLIKNKLAADRPKDRADDEALKKIRRKTS